jgi:DNA primase small subunit
MSRQEKSSVLKDLFREYYEKAELDLPSDIEFREFAYQPFDSESYVRHLSFRTYDEVKNFFIQHVPLHLYFSSATYLSPAAEDMELKGWRGSDLLFDIDSDHIKKCVENKLVKKFRICPECEILSEEPENECPQCSGETIDYIDPECLKYAEEVALDVVDILVEEIGINKRFITVSFSGNRGFHIRVTDERLRSLDRDSRRIIAGFIKASNMHFPAIKIDEKDLVLPPRVIDGGVRRRVANRLLRQIIEPELREYILSSGHVKKDLIKRIDKDLLQRYSKYYSDYAETPIDEMVTMDISRLVRIPNSINGKSGLLTKKIDLNELGDIEFVLEKFSPFHDRTAVIEVRYKLPKIRLLDEEFKTSGRGLYHVRLPVAIYLELKNIGRIKKIL